MKKGEWPIESEGKGYSNIGAEGDSNRAYFEGSSKVIVGENFVEIRATDALGTYLPVITRIVFEETAVPRKLRRLATFARTQGRIEGEMDVEDELRALAVLAKTLDSLEPDARGRVLEWLRSRQVAREMRDLAPADPVAYARDRVLG